MLAQPSQAQPNIAAVEDEIMKSEHDSVERVPQVNDD